MKPSARLARLPFLAATLAMALALILPWAFTPDAPLHMQNAQPDQVQMAAQGGPAAPIQP